MDAEIPPSVLPDISPSRGEIGEWLAPCFKSGARARSHRGIWVEKPVLHPISPLEGEMSGRTEGGNRSTPYVKGHHHAH
ncbi:Hypothetical protein NGAL_HAMBI2566_08170 [Neorhizobium galegae bv. orientalis]|nr:Hypothetical protein NGAL_HAMBI2566_08170 [Neorhizobium galegae bv. orientalis]